ncbi:hypothetical protein BX600DRAFT_440144 [Xylariales sp. PMI_506]|nr:hypothetical protein BX600DRAFT_440144 [Xylariales sp. PMI_506]
MSHWLMGLLISEIFIPGHDRLNYAVVNHIVEGTRESRSQTAKWDFTGRDRYIPFTPSITSAFLLQGRNLLLIQRRSDDYESVPARFIAGQRGIEPLLITCLGWSQRPIKSFLNACARLENVRQHQYTTFRTIHGGSGKSSLIQALAVTSDDHLEALFAQTPRWCLVALKDIDRIDISRNRVSAVVPKGDPRAQTCTLAGLLNPSRTPCNMTANHKERLDEALLWDGRIDRQFHIGNITGKLAKDMFLGSNYDNQGSDNGMNLEILVQEIEKKVPDGSFSAAKFQGYLINYIGQSKTALIKLGQCVKENETA